MTFLSSYNNLYFNKSTDSGYSWTGIVKINNTEDVTSKAMDIDGDGDGETVIIGISYYDRNNADLICFVSDDRGDTWNKYIIDETGDVGYSSSIVVSGNNIYICYIADMVCMLPEPGVNGMRMNIL